MYDLAARKRALLLLGQGLSLNATSKATGISRAAIRSWTERLEPSPRAHDCPRCQDPPRPPGPPGDYAYLLGLYLGDGCISQHLRGVHALRIACADTWPGLMDECVRAMTAVRPRNRACLVRNKGCTMAVSYSKHWPCLFPQHGPGVKHGRRIVLVPWQREIVEEHPWALVRGLIHSDGCRVVNWTTRVVGGERKRYEYPRYFFTNASDDIRAIYTDTLDRLGIPWKRANARNVSVARREAVAVMDEHIGPKH
ncbi:transcriptional regulator [Wenjunlia tyrosinilytica]|uniref:Transcriptional regulator n=1 Tax=Wenjunlia tyrosinilytica TaxID=1544741 RepID=A0A917ZFJ5_9ACTN|nr:transcriptional regulator [Wenjunlia tyrosinilytica]GGO81562.1 hypothetical protein GCM10012280_06110 [Wenjunlia tyrosinilytica]